MATNGKIKRPEEKKELSIKSISSKQGRAMTLGRELADIKIAMEQLKERDGEIRNRLHDILDVGDGFEFEHEKKTWIIEKYETEKTTLFPVEKIYKMMSVPDFLKVVSVTIGRLKETFGKQYVKFIDPDGYEYEPTVRLREKKGS